MAALDSVVVFCLSAARVWHDMRVGVKLHSRGDQLLVVLLLVDSLELLGNRRLWVVVHFLEAEAQVLVASDEVVSAAIAVNGEAGDVAVAAGLSVAVVILFSAALSFSLSSGFSVSAVVIFGQSSEIKVFGCFSVFSRFLDDIVVRLWRVLEPELGLVPSSWWGTHSVIP